MSPRDGSGGRRLRAAAGARLLFFDRDLGPDLLERAPDQARDVHLRDPDLLRDLRLRQALEEAQVEDPPLALVERAEPRREHGAVLRDLVLVLEVAERLERVELLAVLLARPLGERERRVRAAGLERLQHLLLLDARGLRELGDRRRPAELDGELLDELRELHVQLLQPARYAHRPAAVAEVALDLADDVRRRVCRQLDAAVEVEAVDRLDEADRADLHQIVELLAAVAVAPRERADERHVLLDELLARLEIALLVVAAEQDLVVLSHSVSPASSAARTRCRRRPRPRPCRARGEVRAPPRRGRAHRGRRRARSSPRARRRGAPSSSSLRGRRRPPPAPHPG